MRSIQYKVDGMQTALPCSPSHSLSPPDRHNAHDWAYFCFVCNKLAFTTCSWLCNTNANNTTIQSGGHKVLHKTI